jgi:hypothetical protein
MKKLVVMLVAACVAGAGAAQPKGDGCPAAQGESVHLYLKANGKDVKADSPSDASAGAGAGASRMAINEQGIPDRKKKGAKKAEAASSGGADAGGCTVRPQ